MQSAIVASLAVVCSAQNPYGLLNGARGQRVPLMATSTPVLQMASQRVAAARTIPMQQFPMQTLPMQQFPMQQALSMQGTNRIANYMAAPRVADPRVVARPAPRVAPAAPESNIQDDWQRWHDDWTTYQAKDEKADAHNIVPNYRYRDDSTVSQGKRDKRSDWGSYALLNSFTIDAERGLQQMNRARAAGANALTLQKMEIPIMSSRFNAMTAVEAINGGDQADLYLAAAHGLDEKAARYDYNDARAAYAVDRDHEAMASAQTNHDFWLHRKHGAAMDYLYPNSKYGSIANTMAAATEIELSAESLVDAQASYRSDPSYENGMTLKKAELLSEAREYQLLSKLSEYNDVLGDKFGGNFAALMSMARWDIETEIDNISQEQLAAAFEQEHGMSPHQYRPAGDSRLNLLGR